MSIFTRKKPQEEEKKPLTSEYNSLAENELLNKIENAQVYAEGGKRSTVEKDWEDEYKIHIGKQWDTTKGFRSEKGKKRNFNSQDNLVFPMVQNMLAPFSTCPEPDISGVETEDDEAAEVLGDLVANVLYRNNFKNQWKKITAQMIKYGPVIGYVPWDQHWIGGTGPDRWVGEVRTLFLKKEKFFPDPAILDLEERLQECSFIDIKERKKLDWYKETWPEKGKLVIADNELIEEGLEDEGPDPQQATLITHFHKGVPYFVPEEWKKIFLEKAAKAESESNRPYYAKDLRDMAAGTLKGVHCAYKAGTVLLDYVPYIYDDGLYPFVYKVLYIDEKQPWGMGEIRNVIIPQILHNKADEIELGAMLGQGLGGGFYEKGAVSETQKAELLDNIAKANAWHEVNNVNALKPKEPVQIPGTITNYKEGKRNVIDTISQNTAILQGVLPSANVTYSAVAELGARADSRTKDKADILEDFMIEFIQLVVNRIIQFYTEDRKYRILGETKQVAKVQREAYKTLQQIANMPQGTPPEQQIKAMINLLMFVKQQVQAPKTKTYKREMLIKTWERDYEVVKDADGNPIVDGDGNEVTRPLVEEFIPEFDIRVKVRDERPTDRNYWTNIATAVLGKALGVRNFWRIMDEGKLPPIDDIIEEVEQMQQAQAQAAQAALQVQQQHDAQQNDADRQVKLAGQNMTNDTQLKMTAISAAAKGARR